MVEPTTSTAETAAKPVEKASRRVSLDRQDLYFNRELSWVRFNERVLEEAFDERHPLLERVKFLAIFASNLDEFFMIRVSGLRRQLAGGVLHAPPDGMSPTEQLTALRELIAPLLDRSVACWRDDLRPALAEAGVAIRSHDDLDGGQRRRLRRLFLREIFPALTPLAFDPGHPFPHISNLSLNLAVAVREPGHDERFARVKVPYLFPRLLAVPRERDEPGEDRLGLGDAGASELVWLEEVVAANLDTLFPGLEIVSAHPFRVTRDADVEIEEDEASDLLSAMEVVVGQRHFGSAVRLEIDRRMPERILEILVSNLEVAPYQVYSMEEPLGRSSLMELTQLDRPDLRDPPFKPTVPAPLAAEESIFSVVGRRDVLLHHPYDSFKPVVEFVRQAAEDPQVLAIKQTLYRVGANSPIVQALREARENGKQVSVLVELKARFDEQNNIVWARSLERAGVHVVYGLVGLKTHAKMCLVVRREADGLKQYVHLSTGNYNPATARVYTDLGYFSSRPELTADVAHLFNALTGYSAHDDYQKLLVAPGGMRRQILERIRREVEHHRDAGDGYLGFKMNALVDQRVIRALYRASIAGVKIDLQVRGICCLRPGVPGISDNITVTSVVGRFLEHARIYYFRNGGDEEILIGSADLMPRNLDGRVEVLFPIDDPRLRDAVRDQILFVNLADRVQARELGEDGVYRRRLRPEGAEAVDSQRRLLSGHRTWHLEETSG